MIRKRGKRRVGSCPQKTHETLDGPSTSDDHSRHILPLLPAIPLKFRIEMLLRGIADTEISNQGPCLRDVKYSAYDFRLENGNPTNAQSLGTRGEPKGLHRGNDRVPKRLRHGLTAQASSCRRRLIGEHRKMDRSVF